MIYFAGIEHDLKQCKLRYKQWCKILHPDAGGNATYFKDMQEEYNTILKPKITKEKSKHTVFKENNVHPDAYHQTKDFINLASNVIGLVKTSIGLAKEINTMLELDNELNIIKDHKNET
jgi:hypothetical protein